jgi:hypothetical protein
MFSHLLHIAQCTSHENVGSASARNQESDDVLAVANQVLGRR